MSDLALEAAVARAYVDALRSSLLDLAEATKLHGLPRDADALVSEIHGAIDKANTASINAGVAYLTARENVSADEEIVPRVGSVPPPLGPRVTTMPAPLGSPVPARPRAAPPLRALPLPLRERYRP
jgi:hypothetical protein